MRAHQFSYSIFICRGRYKLVVRKQKKFNPFYVYTFYIDTPDYLADTIINDVCLPIDILDEKHVKTQEGKAYIVVHIKYQKKYEERFKRFLDILRYNMLMYNNSEYISDCKELTERIKDGKILKGTWS